jgi:hypothetical protein
LNVLSERRAKSTTEWFLSCVNSGVSSERWCITKGFFT